MKSLDVKLLREFLDKAGAKLKGKWVLLGGTLLPAVGLHIRSTVDIDLVGLGTSESAQALELMELVESLGLSVETINQTAAFFLKKAGYKTDDLLVLHKGKSATIFRPSADLYWRLKIARLSESDLIDCQHYVQYCKGQRDRINTGRLLKAVHAALETSTNSERNQRLKVLAALVNAP